MNAPHLRRRPLIGIGVILCLGTYAGLAGLPRLSRETVAGACLIWMLGALISRFRPAGRPLALWTGLLLLAWLNAGLFSPPVHALPEIFAAPMNQPVTLQGRIVSDPLLIARPRNQPPLCSFDLRADAVDHCGRPTPLPPRLNVAVVLSRPDRQTAPPLPRYGDRIRLSGRLTRKPAPTGHLRFDLQVDDSPANRELLGRGTGNRLAAYCYDRRREAARRIARGIEGDRRALGVIRALILGYRRQIDSSLYRAFASTGTLHIFAVSGSHVAILTLFGAALARSLRLPRTRWIWVWTPLLIGYTVATGMEPSAVRACLMALTLAGAWAINRSGDIFSITALAAIVLILADPSNLTAPGFILSFVTVLGLTLVIPPAWEALQARWRRARELELPELPFRRRLFIGARHSAAALLLATGAAWIVSLPLNLYYFKLFSWVSLPGNLITLPLAFLLMLSGGLSLLAGAVWAPIGTIFNFAHWRLARLLMAALEQLNALPYGHFKIEGFPAWAVWAYYACGAGLLCWIYRRRGEQAEEFDEQN